jgi:hypothetical protein
MSTATETKPWDLSHVVEFSNAFSLSPDNSPSRSLPRSAPKADAATPRATDPLDCADNITAIAEEEQDGGGVGLGDFGKVWQFLGTPAPPKHEAVRPDDNGKTSTFASKLDYTSDGATYIASKARSTHQRHPSFTDGTDGEGSVGQVSATDTQEQALSKTQKKRMRRRERKAREALQELSKGNRLGAVSESEADSAFGNRTPARKASAHLLKESLTPRSGPSNPPLLQHVNDALSGSGRLKENSAKPTPPAEQKLRGNNQKKAAQDNNPNAPKVGDTRPNASRAIHNDNLATPSKSKAASHTAAGQGSQKSRAAAEATAKDSPTSDEEDITNQAVNAVAAALASIKNGASQPTSSPTPNSSAPRSRAFKPPTTPVKPPKSIPVQSQPVPKYQNLYHTPQQQTNHLAMFPASVQPRAQPFLTGNPPPFNAHLQHPVAQQSESAKKSKPQYAIEPRIIRSGEDRHWALFMKLLNTFSEDRKHLVSPMNMTNHNRDPNGIHVFVDASNIFIGFMDMLKSSRGIHPMAHLPQANLSFDGLALLMERRRPVAKRVLAGSNPWLPAFDKAKAVGYEMNIFEKVLKSRELTERQLYFKDLDARRWGKGSKAPPANPVLPKPASSPTKFSVLGNGSGNGGIGSGTETSTPPPQYAPPKMIEQGVDEILHLKILESIVDYETPSTIVLATGDAAQAEYSQGFMAMAERALKKGWRVELVSWSKNISKTYLKSQWTSAWEGRFRIVYLDDFAEELLDM